MKYVFIFILAMLLLVACQKEVAPPTLEIEPEPAVSIAIQEPEQVDEPTIQEVVEYGKQITVQKMYVEAWNTGLEPEAIVLKEGILARITFHVRDWDDRRTQFYAGGLIFEGPWGITDIVEPGTSRTVEFVPDHDTTYYSKSWQGDKLKAKGTIVVR